MADVVVIDSSPVDGSSQSGKKAKKSLKRKRASLVPENVSAEERESRVDELRGELLCLFQYFKEGLTQKVHFEEREICSSGNSVFACLLEESDLPFSKLVEEIYEKLKNKEGITLASVRSTVLLVGQRSMYGIANADADVLEDDSDECLWCWETRDLKLIPKNQRGVLNIRRICRKKIHERITVVSAMIAALQMPLSHPNYKIDLMKASDKLVKVLNEADIRVLVENLVQKNGADMAEKEAKLKEKELTKELERNKREVEKEKKRMDRELQKDKLQNEKELKRLQDEAEKEARRREKEEAETKKQLKRQQEEAEKEQRRREKEAADLKKQLAIQKQATIMERFLRSKKNNSSKQDDVSSMKSPTFDSSKERDENKLNVVTLSMDRALSSEDGIDTSDLWKSHINAWNRLGRCTRLDSLSHWGMRRKPKTALIKELKLQGLPSVAAGQSAKVVASNKGVINRDEMNIDKLVDEWEETIPDDKSCKDNADDVQICNRIKKLLQFDKSNRPAYYGTFDVIGPRHPFKKDPDLDYDIESDEEWEEEDPGESLSDCDKDEEEDILEEGNLRTEDEDGSEDGFLVPDGYLSENEGVHVDSMEVDCIDDEARSLPRSKEDVETEEFRILLRQQKYINKLTEHALQKNQPLIISNLMHEKATLLTTEGLSGTPKIEQMFLQSLSLRPFPGAAPIQISTDNNTPDEDQEVCQSQSKGSATPATPVSVIQDKDLRKIVSAIQASPQGINKVMEYLQQRLPNVPKSQLKNKVREIAQFVDNRWQVKKEIMDKLGLSLSPEKCSGRTKSIATFFSKRCLPPAGETIKTDKTSPQPCRQPDCS
ncbi:Chromatin assembly factor 1 subunit A [Macleaya cordata]|uniref:Chromatin assembly factor 1 subunit A n=1 Tax=Macleaya cordata TaxID=56857 RepID=A0A200Q3X7_MACCD|nr:Chromatin assembly factor 1 subunit A [Macleaya cordata]